MSLWSRIANVIRGDRLSREIDEEFQSHIAEPNRRVVRVVVGAVRGQQDQPGGQPGARLLLRRTGEYLDLAWR
jgi:hypothetical protein